MNASSLIDNFSAFARQKNIDRPTLIRILEEVFRTVIKKQFVNDENFDIIINVDKGDLEIWRYRQIVSDDAEEVDDNLEIRLSEALKIEPDFEVGEEVAQEVKIEDFGRRLVQAARQTLIQKVKDLEKEMLFQKYKEHVGDLISCDVYQALSKELILRDNEGNELSLPKSEMISKDRFRKGDSVRAIVQRVEMRNNNPRIVLSRISPEFLGKLF